MSENSLSIKELLRLAAEKFESGDMLCAKAACDQIIASEPTQPHALNFLALIARQIKKWGKAEEIARFGCDKNPQNAQLTNTLGLIMLDQRRLAEAEVEFRRSHVLKPDRPEFLGNLGVTLQAKGRWEEARDVFTAALNLNPHFVPALAGRATAATDLGLYEDAQSDIQLAESLNPNDLELLNSIARLALCRGDLDEAYAAFDRTVSLSPNVADARVNRGLVRVLQGRISEGWEDYCMRRARRWGRPSNRHLDLPGWKGESLAGKRVLVWSELGLGEVIMCTSLIKELAAEAHQIILEVDPRLVELFSRSLSNVTVIPEETPANSKIQSTLPDVQIPIIELVGYRGADSATREPKPAYLKPHASNVAVLKEKYLTEVPGQPLVGLSWGSPEATSVRQKSIAAEWWAPVLRTPGVTFVNLQYGEARQELNEIATQYGATLLDDPSVDPAGSLSPFADQCAALDLVITVSNTTAHISGAIGQETWVLVPPLGLGSMWFWFVDRATSPWYPAVKLWRREMNKDEAFVADIADRLQQWAADRN